MLNSVLEAIGHTPLLFLKMSLGLPGNVWLKLENRNPGGSIKDRAAFQCVAGAMARGELQPGGTVICASSGNMGIALALVARARGMSCLITMPESMSEERRALIKGYGAELFLTPADQGMNGSLAKAEELRKEKKGWMLDQFSNPDMVKAHYETTGPEILYGSGGKMDAVVAGIGSGSTLMGVGKCLKEAIPHFRIIAVEPKDSPVLSGGKPAPHIIQGIGPGFVPKIVDRSIIDEVLEADGQAALAMARKLMAEEGICCGISSGANVGAALHVAARPEMSGKNIVTFACDTGERYLSTALFKEGQ